MHLYKNINVIGYFDFFKYKSSIALIPSLEILYENDGWMSISISFLKWEISFMFIFWRKHE